MPRIKTPWEARRVRHQRSRQTLAGTGQRPRLSVFRSARHTYAQVIDDTQGRTLAAADTREVAKKPGAAKKAVARELGKLIAQRSKATGITAVVFDRGGFLYHGRVQEVADGAREEGLQF